MAVPRPAHCASTQLPVTTTRLPVYRLHILSPLQPRHSTGPASTTANHGHSFFTSLLLSPHCRPAQTLYSALSTTDMSSAPAVDSTLLAPLRHSLSTAAQLLLPAEVGYDAAIETWNHDFTAAPPRWYSLPTRPMSSPPSTSCAATRCRSLSEAACTPAGQSVRATCCCRWL